MTKKTVDELPTIGDTQEENAQTIIQQNGVTFKGRERPNPPRKINITSQAQLETQFGVNIEIPDGESFLISVDDNFTLTKPIKIGLGSAVRFQGGTSSVNVTYTGTGAMFQNTNPANPIDSFDIRLIRITGGLFSAITNNAFDLVGGANSFFFVNTAQIVAFNDIGFIDIELVEIQSLGIFAVNEGFTIKDPNALSIRVVILDQSGLGDTGMTAFSFIQNNPTLILLEDIRGIVLSASESVVFFDPNAPVNASYAISTVTVAAGNLFQRGKDTTIVSVADNAGQARFLNNQFHDLAVGDTVTLSGFATAAYNGEFEVTVVPDPERFETGVAFVAGDTGILENSKFEVISAAAGGGGGTAFTTRATNNLQAGEVVVQTSHADAAYNGTFVISKIISTTIYEIDEIPFTATDQGFVTTRSLDSEDVPVSATNNPGQPESMFTAQAGLEVFAAPATVTINTIGVPEAITSASWNFSNLERFIEGVINEGQVIAQDIAVRRYAISYSATIERVGGGAQTLSIVLLKNGVDVSFNPPITVNTGQIEITRIEIIELTEADTLQVGVVNLVDAADIDVSQANLVINRA